MRSSELVKLKNDTNYIPSKWEVIEATIGSGDGNVWLKRVAYGVDTENHLKEILNEYYYNPPQFAEAFPDQQRSQVQRDGLNNGLVGPLNEYVVETISNISMYTRPDIKGRAPVDIG